MPKQAPRNLIRGARSAAGLGLVATTTWIAFEEIHANALIAGFAYVLIVLIVAARWGLIESLLTSVAAMLCLNYFFLPPVGSLTIADPQNWVALFAFMVTAVTASKLSASARSRATEAQARRAEVEQLYQISLSLLRPERHNAANGSIRATKKAPAPTVCRPVDQLVISGWAVNQG